MRPYPYILVFFLLSVLLRVTGRGRRSAWTHCPLQGNTQRHINIHTYGHFRAGVSNSGLWTTIDPYISGPQLDVSDVIWLITDVTFRLWLFFLHTNIFIPKTVTKGIEPVISLLQGKGTNNFTITVLV